MYEYQTLIHDIIIEIRNQIDDLDFYLSNNFMF